VTKAVIERSRRDAEIAEEMRKKCIAKCKCVDAK
jgi:hypothetical protein